MAGSWIEVDQADKEKKCELVFSGAPYSNRIAKSGLDLRIFEIKHLNYLEISKTCLKALPSDIKQLSNLIRLILCHNELSTFPTEISVLSKLKFLDISHNAITELPDEISQLKSLQSLNVSYNNLSSLPCISGLENLIILNIAHNQFSSFPVSICNDSLVHFTDFIANNNKITEIPSEIKKLTSLKIFDMGDNMLQTVPGELGNCNKIKELNLKGNKLTDKRLLKLIDQCHVKQILDYVRNHCLKSNTESSKEGKSKKKGKKKSSVEEVDGITDQLKILHVSDETIKVIVSSKVADVRPYIVCCKVLDVNLTDDGMLKKFIALQTKLHDSVCEKRTVATIATHDFLKIHGNILYDARVPKEIMIMPLSRKKELSAEELYSQLNDEAEAIRKEKKKNTYSGIHRYLFLLRDKPLYPCLIDVSSNSVISFPPITNSEVTKISSETTSMLLEVTGNNLNTCKKVMDSLIVEMLKLGIGNKSSVDVNEDEERNTLTVEQVKVVDEEGVLKVVYPSRTDIQFEGVLVHRT